MAEELSKESEDLKGRDMSPAMVEKARAPRKTWFFKRLGDGMIMACEAKEAWQICYNKSAWRRKDFQILGTSDGTTFKKIIDGSIAEARRLSPTIDKQREQWQRFMTSEENLITNEAVDMEGDPKDEVNEVNKQKVLRLRTIIEREGQKLDELEEEYRDKVGRVVKRATDEEMKVAIANQAERLKQGLDYDWPDENMNINTPGGSHKPRKVIVGLMQGGTAN